MKKKILLGIGALALAAVASFNVMMSQASDAQADLLIQNVEILAQADDDGGGTQYGPQESISCYKTSPWGMVAGTKEVCKATNLISCSSHECD